MLFFFNILGVFSRFTRIDDDSDSDSVRALLTLEKIRTEPAGTLYSDPRDYDLRKPKKSDPVVVSVDDSYRNALLLKEKPTLIEPAPLKLFKKPLEDSSEEDDGDVLAILHSKNVRERYTSPLTYSTSRYDVGGKIEHLKDKIKKMSKRGLRSELVELLEDVHSALEQAEMKLDEMRECSRWRRLKLTKILSILKEYVEGAMEMVRMVEKDRVYDDDEIKTFEEGCADIIRAAKSLIHRITED